MTPLVVKKRIRAEPARLFDAWTRPEELCKWWGPVGVECIAAEVDLRVGGRYRLANRFSDGKTVWISGEYELIEPPLRLVYTWRLEHEGAEAERVTVTFVAAGPETEVTVLHEKITDSRRDGHERGWIECLAGLARRFEN